MRKKLKDEWDEITYPTLSAEENELIREARRKGFAIFYPYTATCDQNTLRAAKEHLDSLTSKTNL